MLLLLPTLSLCQHFLSKLFTKATAFKRFHYRDRETSLPEQETVLHTSDSTIIVMCFPNERYGEHHQNAVVRVQILWRMWSCFSVAEWKNKNKNKSERTSCFCWNSIVRTDIRIECIPNGSHHQFPSVHFPKKSTSTCCWSSLSLSLSLLQMMILLITRTHSSIKRTAASIALFCIKPKRIHAREQLMMMICCCC